MLTRIQGSQQSQRKTNLAKLKKTKSTDPVEKAPTPIPTVEAATESGFTTKSTKNQSSKFKNNKTTDTVEEDHIPLQKDGDTELLISIKSTQNRLAKIRKVKLLTQYRKILSRYAKMGTRNQGSQQCQRKTKLAKLRKTDY